MPPAATEDMQGILPQTHKLPNPESAALEV